MKRYLILGTVALAACTSLTSCGRRTGTEVWEDTKTCGRYMGKGVRSFFGQHPNGKDYNSYREWEEGQIASRRRGGNEFIGLSDTENFKTIDVKEYPISRESPGDPGSPIPGVDGFYSPSGHLAELFNRIRFATDCYSIQGSDNISTLREIASYLVANEKTYVFIEGHADERGPATYNFSLASKRANAVRAFLIENGVNPDQLFTISYGLERPIALGHDELAWQENRRAQFKLYDRKS